MSTQIQRRRGTTAEHSTFTGVEGELTIDTTKDTAVVHDGTTVGGHPLQKQYPALGSASTPTYTFTGDTNTGIYSPGADQLAISTAGSGRLFVDANGNIAIGTSATSNFGATARSFDINSAGGIANLYVKTGTVNGGLQADAGNGYMQVWTASNHPIAFNIAFSEKMRLDTSGRLGVGTSAPGKILDVRASNTEVRATCASTDYTAFLAAADGGVNCRIGAYATVDGFAGTTSNHPFSLQTNSATRLYITAAGNVGIGTTSPAGKCVVRVSNNTGAPTAWNSNFLVVSNGDASTSSGIGFSVDTSDSSASISALTPGTGWLKQYYRANSHTFWYGDAGVTQGMTLDSSGRLLVGTSSALAAATGVTPAFQVQGTGENAYASIARWAANSANPGLIFNKSRGASVGTRGVVAANDRMGEVAFGGDDGTSFIIGASIVCDVDGTPGINDMPGRLVFSVTRDSQSSPTEALRITNGGETRIFCVTTAQGLIINHSDTARNVYAFYEGRYSATDNTGSTGTRSYIVYTSGDVRNVNNSYGAISDIKLKENIVDANSQWDDLKALQVRNYNFKEGQTHTQIGLVAQEVELVSPGLVSESPDRDEEGNDLGTVTKSVNYSVLYMKAVKALQEAMARIEQLEAKVAALETA